MRAESCAEHERCLPGQRGWREPTRYGPGAATASRRAVRGSMPHAAQGCSWGAGMPPRWRPCVTTGAVPPQVRVPRERPGKRGAPVL